MTRVVALVTHFNRPHLIAQAVESLLAQSRPLDEIIVMDDASSLDPLAVIPAHPLISVYRSPVNVGPYRLIDWGFRRIRADWYLIQDSDDISVPSRLERLLSAARREGAGMVGSAIRNVGPEPGQERVMSFNADAVAAHLSGAWPACAMCSSIIARDLWEAVGGFATGLRFSGDVEFVSRACHAGKVVNVETIELHRRLLPDSLTQHPDTGMRSAARLALRERLQARAQQRVSDHRAGIRVDLAPISVLGNIELRLLRHGSPHPPHR